MPASMAAPMSSVCTWQFQRPSPPTTTIESPSSPHADLKPSIVLVGRVEEEHHLVAEVGDVAALAGPHRRAACAPTATELCTSSTAGSGRVGHHVQARGEQQLEPATAGVDDAGLAQHREQVGGARDRVAGGAGGALEHAGERGLALGHRPLHRLRGRAHDGEDGALDRAQHRLVGGVGRPGAARRRRRSPTPRRAARRCRPGRAGSGRGSRPSCPGRP